jgi:hypothetical protein
LGRVLQPFGKTGNVPVGIGNDPSPQVGKLARTANAGMLFVAIVE